MAGPGGTEVGRVSVRVVPDTDKFRGMLRERLRSINQELQLSVTVDEAKLRADLDRGIRRASVGIRATVPIDFIPGTAELRARLQAAVDAAARGVEAEIRIRFNGDDVARLNNSLGGGGGGSPGDRLLKIASSATKAGFALGAMGNAVGAIAGLVAAISQLAGAALLLPGLLLAGGAAFAALKVGMSGVSDALNGDAEAMAKLAPAARSTVQAIQGFKTEWEGVKQATQGALFEGLADQVKSLGSQYLPVLKTGLSGIAGEFNLMAKSAGTALAETRQVQGVSELFANVRQAISLSTNTLRDFLVGFLDLGIIGSDYLKPMAEYIGRAAASFRLWASDTSNVRGIIDGAIQGFRDLFAIVENVGSIISLIWTGLSNGSGATSFLATLRELTATAAAFFATVEAQTALQTLGAALQVAGQAVRDVLLAALQAAAPIVAGLAPIFAAVASQVSSILVPAFQMLGDLFTTWGPTLQQNADLIAAFILALGGIGLVIKGVQIAITAYNAVMKAWRAITVAFTAVQWLLNLALSANPIALVVIAIAALVAILILAWNNSETFRNIVTTAWNAVLAAGQGLVDGVTAAFAWFGTLPGLFMGWLEGAGAAVDQGIAAILQWFVDLPGNVVNTLGNLSRLLWDAGVSIVTGLWNGLKAAFQPVIDWVSGIAAWIASVKGPLPYDRRLLIPAGEAIMQGLHKGLKDNFGDVLSLVGGMAEQIASPFSSPIDVNMNAGIEEQFGSLPSGMSGEVRGLVSSDDFGIDAGGIAGAVVAGLTGSTLRVDGNGVAKLVNKSNTRKDRRG